MERLVQMVITAGLITLFANERLLAASSPRTVERIADRHIPSYEDANTFARLGNIGGTGIILIPGGEVAARRYLELAEDIVSQDHDVSVFVARFTRDYVTPWEVGPKVKAILEAMNRLGWSSPESTTYLAAHSMGGLFGHGEVYSYRLQGLILMASYLPQAAIGGAPYDVSRFSKPILILGGEWDRRVDIHVQARAFADFQLWQKSHPDDPSKVVGILPGASHMQFADGELLASDVAPTRSSQDVRAQIARTITAFLREQDPRRSRPQDRQVLHDLVEVSRKIFSPVFAVESWDRRACSWLQGQLVPATTDPVPSEPQIFQSYGAFARARPETDAHGSLRVPTHLEQPPNPFDLPGTPFGIPVALSCKFTLPHAPGTSRLTRESPCEEADRLLAHAVKGVLTPEQIERVESAETRLDVSSRRVSSLALWLVTPTSFRNRGDATRWESQSVEWVEAIGQRDIVTCKLTPPTRWLFYYMRDAHLTSLDNAVRL